MQWFSAQAVGILEVALLMLLVQPGLKAERRVQFIWTCQQTHLLEAQLGMM